MSEQKMMAPWDVAAAEVQDHLPALMIERSRLRSAGFNPTAVVIPARLNVPYEGDDATDYKATCMGLPAQWSEGEQWGLVIPL
jgi:hypothetical protein